MQDSQGILAAACCSRFFTTAALKGYHVVRSEQRWAAASHISHMRAAVRLKTSIALALADELAFTYVLLSRRASARAAFPCRC